jgi:hypothetical protein
MPARTDAFSSDGFVVLRDAIAPDVIRSCVEAIEDELRRHAVDPRDRTTWTEPVVRLACPEGPAFAEAGTSPALRAAYDELLGPGRWIRREGVGGTWANVRSRGRGLLALFLFTDVSDDDAPTELIVGSHLDVPRVLGPFGERGVFRGDVVPHLARFTFERPRARATGRAGDVFLCHPFLVHRATWPHRGDGPRMVAQPGVAIPEPFTLRVGPGLYPVEQAILRGLGERSP